MGKRTGKEDRATARLKQELDAALRENKLLLAQAYAGFNAAVDQELVEAYIYEIQAIRARYSYLLRQRKALDKGCGEPAPAGGSGLVLPVA